MGYRCVWVGYREKSARCQIHHGILWQGCGIPRDTVGCRGKSVKHRETLTRWYTVVRGWDTVNSNTTWWDTAVSLWDTMEHRGGSVGYRTVSGEPTGRKQNPIHTPGLVQTYRHVTLKPETTTTIYRYEVTGVPQVTVWDYLLPRLWDIYLEIVWDAACRSD